MGTNAFHITLLLKRGQENMKKTIYSDAYRIVREWLILMRKNKTMSQRDLASILQVPHSWVGKIETGERRLDIVEYCRICNALNVAPHEGLELCLQKVNSDD